MWITAISLMISGICAFLGAAYLDLALDESYEQLSSEVLICAIVLFLGGVFLAWILGANEYDKTHEKELDKIYAQIFETDLTDK